jgi:nucleoside-diphosphate-sugar epimerase
MSKVVLVTGATGRIGQRLEPALLAEGHAVRALVRSSDRAVHLRESGADAVVGDLTDTGSIAIAVDGVSSVIHLAAAYGGGDQSLDDINVAASRVLAIAAIGGGVRSLVLASTSLVYGPGRGRAAREDDPTCPMVDNHYAVSKVREEVSLLELHHNRGLPLRIVRLAFVYGGGDPHLAEATTWARRWPADRRLHMLHHDDACQALVAAWVAPGIDGLVVNAADDQPIAAAELCRLLGAPPPAASGPADPWETVVDTERMRNVLGVHLRHPSVYYAQEADAL